MSKQEKLRKRFLSKPKNFTWDELRALLRALGYLEFNIGKTSGSRVRFKSKRHGDIILHKPHPNPNLKAYQLRQLIEHLKKEGLL